MAMKTAPNYAGLLQWSRCKFTGHQYGLYDGIAAGLDTDAGRWQTVCEDHGTICSHTSIHTARRFMASGDWCEVCMAEVSGMPRDLVREPDQEGLAMIEQWCHERITLASDAEVRAMMEDCLAALHSDHVHS